MDKRISQIVGVATLFLALLWTTPAAVIAADPPLGVVVRLDSEADAYVLASQPSTNYGSGPIGVIPDGQGLVRFDLSALPADAIIQEAVLRMMPVDIVGTDASTITVDRMDGAWREMAVNWGNLPSSTTTEASATVSTYDWITWDVTATVTEWHTDAAHNYGFGLNTADLGVYFHSKETGDAPQLVITYTFPDEHDDPLHPEARPHPDLGDAPDSTNHHGVVNIAYPDGTAGSFPTVWEDPGNPSGPKHLNESGEAWLGRFLSSEREADIGPDADGVNNILAGGVDNANNDRGDDGWLNRRAPFVHCAITTLRVRVSKAPGSKLDRMILNAWFDGSRDGDWQDVDVCVDAEGQSHRAFEWVVQNHVVDLTTIPTGGHRDIVVNTVRVLNQTPDRSHWVRFTLSEHRLDSPAVDRLPDGRGPQHPNSFQHGETEDYHRRPEPHGEPGKLDLNKTARTESDIVRPGDTVNYQIEVAHEGGSGPAGAVLVDELPRGMRLVGRPEFSVAAHRVSPHGVVVRDNKIIWAGLMSPGAKFKINYAMRAVPCFDGQTHRIRNEVTLRPTRGTAHNAEAVVALRCHEIDPGAIEISRVLLADDAAIVDNEVPIDELSDLLPQNRFRIRSTFTNKLDQSITLGLRSFERVVPANEQDSQAASVDSQSEATNLDKLTLAAGETKSFIQEIEASEELDRDALVEVDLISELAFCLLGEDAFVCPGAESIRHAPPVRIHIRHRDLGDAPDSSNHFGVNMHAYAGTNAHFPTVYDPSTGTPPGPVHLFPGPFHLGRLVSREVEADRGRDADPFNNLHPRRDQANLDRRDDGLRPRSLDFVDCESATVSVAVTISPLAVAYLHQQGGQGYLNMWLDSNRDGDWADVAACETEGEQTARALEHIVVDHAVDADALGPGWHVIQVETGLVSWPEKHGERPVWLRVTLSEHPSNKTLADDDFAYGDGRGYLAPFVLGETEDYKIHLGDLVDGADVAVHKRGTARKDFEREEDSVVGRTYWHIRYWNQGLETAQNTVIRDVLPPELDVTSGSLTIRTNRDLTYELNGHEITFNVGELESERGGHIVIRADYAIPDAEAAAVTNRVAISATNDANPENNRGQATVQLGLRAPVITWPGNGSTCDGELEVRGRVRRNALVDLYLNDALIATVAADDQGRWNHSLSLEDGTHDLYAIARLDDISSLKSRTKTVIVDSSLVYDPLSVVFVDENGNHRRPRDENGRTDAAGWGLHLRPNTEYVVAVRVCCGDPNASVTLDIPGVGVVELLYSEERDRFIGEFTTGDIADEPSSEAMSLSITCDGTTYTFDGTILIDPEGVVYDVYTGQLLAGANVACMEAQANAATGNSATTFALWDAEAFGQINPQSTLADGYFSFWTPQGTYQLEVSRDGYQSYRSWDIQVIDELVRYDVPLSPAIEAEADHVIEITESGFSPAVLTAQPGAVIEWVNMDLSNHSVTADAAVSAPIIGMSNGTWDSGLLAAGESYKLRFDAEGSFGYSDHENGMNEGTIIVASVEDTPAEPSDGDETPADSDQLQLYLPLVLE